MSDDELRRALRAVRAQPELAEVRVEAWRRLLRAGRMDRRALEVAARYGDAGACALVRPRDVELPRSLEGDASVLREVQRWLSLRRLSLPAWVGLGERGLGVLCDFEDLRVLRLQGVWSGATQLHGLRDLPRLQQLDLEGWYELEDDDLAPLQALRGLERLSLRGSGIEGPGLHVLRDLRVRVLVLSECVRLEPSTWTALGGLPQLREVELERAWLSEGGIEALGGLELRALRAREWGECTHRGAQVLAGISSLEELDVGGSAGLRGASAARLAGAAGLRSLGVSGCNVTDRSVARFGRLERLEELDLARNERLSERAVRSVARFGALRRLDASGLRGVARWEALGGARRLEWLRLANNASVGNDACAALASLPLRALDLSGCTRVTHNGLAALRESPQLEALSLRGCWRVTDACLETLRALPRLWCLRVDGCSQLGDTFVEGLRELRGLRVLELHGPALTDRAAAALAELEGLTQLLVRGARWSPAAVERMRTLPNLRVLAGSAGGPAREVWEDVVVERGLGDNLTEDLDAI